jgi:hypothetical protein
MPAAPNLQVLGAIVVFDAVQVVYRFIGQEDATELALYYSDVLEDVSAVAGTAGMSWLPNHHIPAFVVSPTALPITVAASSQRPPLQAHA